MSSRRHVIGWFGRRDKSRWKDDLLLGEGPGTLSELASTLLLAEVAQSHGIEIGINLPYEITLR